MPPSSKAKASGVSASSFLDLKSELAKRESEFAKRKAVGKTYEVGSSRGTFEGDVGRKGKGTIWARSNKGIEARRARDVEALRADKSTAESAREALEKKAKIYEKLKKGKSGGLTDAQYDNLLVDFDSKGVDAHYSSDSEDVDESLTVPKPPDDEDDPVVEYEDEFGRMRTARRSEVPRNLMRTAGDEEEEEIDPLLIHNPVDHFPVYEPSAERIADIKEAAKDSGETHYDAAKEVRARGAAFYAFSSDEEKRRMEMEALRVAREETEKTRKEMGAVDIKVGEVEGMVPSSGEGSGANSRSKAMEKRKREIEERRRLLDAKRRKVKGEHVEEASDELQKSESSILAQKSPGSPDPQVMNSKSNEDSHGGPVNELHSSKTDKPHRLKKKTKVKEPVDADAFLAQLEMDLTSQK